MMIAKKGDRPAFSLESAFMVKARIAPAKKVPVPIFRLA
jgi:hypothetical protein